MKIELTNTEWTQISDFYENVTYFLQAKRPMTQAGAGQNRSYLKQDINFSRSAEEPTDDQEAFFGSAFKFKSDGSPIWVKAVACPTIIYAEEVV